MITKYLILFLYFGILFVIGFYASRKIKSMKDYYEEVSYGAFTVSAGPSGVAGWYAASKRHNYYGRNDIYGYDVHPAELVIEALQAADAAGFDFAPYDMDGDCYVDVVHGYAIASAGVLSSPIKSDAVHSGSPVISLLRNAELPHPMCWTSDGL